MANILDKIASTLLVIGGLNWGLYGLLNFDLVQVLLGFLPIGAQAVYFLVALAGIYKIYQVLPIQKKR